MNVLIDPLPEEWNGVPLNMAFQVGIQITQAFYDPELTHTERGEVIAGLLFARMDNVQIPDTPEAMRELLTWYMSGWNLDHAPKDQQTQKLLDYEVDQWRIYADFRNIYGINLNEADLHWWEFQGMLWNMPYERSSFLQVIEIRKKKITGSMSAKERSEIAKAKRIYALTQPGGGQKKPLSREEENAIDAFDKQMEAMRERKGILEQIAEEFNGRRNNQN